MAPVHSHLLPLALLLLAGCSAPPPATLRSLYRLPRVSSLTRASTALVIVDFQREFFDGALPLPNGPEAARNAARLLAWARARGIFVVHVRNVSERARSPLFRDGTPQVDFVPALVPTPRELVITKSAAGAFTHTDLEERLRARGIDTLIVAGLMTHLAVDTTARDGAIAGFRVVVASDGCATRDLSDGEGVIDHATVHRVALASLADRFADVATTRAVVSWPVDP